MDRATGDGGWRQWVRPLASVRVRITLAAVVVTSVAVGAAGWLLVRSVENAQIRQLRDEINADLDQVAERLQEGDDPVEAVAPRSSGDPSEAVQATAPVGFVEVIDESGRVVASSSPTFPGLPSLERGQGPVNDGPPPSEGDLVGTVSGPGRVIALPLEVVTRTVETPTGRLTVRGIAPVDPQAARSIDALRSALVIGMPALIALVATIAYLLVGRALRPVEAIRAEVDAITGSTMHRRVPEPPTHDEIGSLARTMNAMLDRLDAAATDQRRFVSDASHELRSPVAAIRTGLEVARRKADRADWPTVADAALTEEARLEALLDDLLLLAAHDEKGAARHQPEPVDLAVVAVSEAERPRRVPVRVARPGAAGNGDAGTLTVLGSADQLARVVSNLVDNAARHAASEVQVSVSSHDGIVRLAVEDDGPGVPPAERARVFERFTRLDDGRAREEGGTGLGLAVARSIIDRHHGRIWVDDSPLGGARFVVELPGYVSAPGLDARISTEE